jgi:adenylate cyclase
MLGLGGWDAVLLEIVMPDLDGIAVLRAIKMDTELRKIPVVMVSGHADANRLATCLDAGADDFLSKPIHPAVLSARVRSAVIRKWQADAERCREAETLEEQARSDQLLHAIFPAYAVDSLRASGTVAPRRYDNVSVIFCDIVGFTSHCEHHAPEVVVAYLDELYRAFEAVCEAVGVEKIKTIGDAFMAAAGLDHRSSDTAAAAMACARAFVAAAATSSAGWQVRVGIATGPVVAGVVGGAKYAYDLWGDTVNTAARIESLAQPGEVWCCETTRRAAGEAERVEFAGNVTPKGKGRIKVYRVTRPSRPVRDEE